MSISPEPENRLICPNCQALNAPYAVICESCGVQMDEFRAALPRLKQLKENRTASHRELLEEEFEVQVKGDISQSLGSFRNLLLLLLLFVIVAGVIISIGAYFYANQVKQTQAEIRAQYETSLTCMQAEKYLCAKDGLQNLIASGVTLPELAENLNQAQFGLSKQYFESGQWELAVNELEELLTRDPGNQPAISLLKNSYDQWIKQLSLEGNWLKKWIIRRERDARFPPGIQ